MSKSNKTNLLLLVAEKVAASCRFILFLVLLTGVILYTRAGAPERAHAAVPATLNFQARLLNSNGSIVADGYYNVEFKLYDASSGGTNVWTETWYDSNGGTAGNDNRVQVKSGYLSVYLGDQTAFGAIDWTQQYWMTMNIGGTTQTATPTWDGEMNPRLRLTSVPYAQAAAQAEDSNTLDGIDSAGFVQTAPGSVQGVNSANSAIRLNQTGAGNLLQLQSDGSDVLTLSNSGVLTVTGTANFNGGLTVANGQQLTNAGSTLLTAAAITDKPTGGAIGTAATTVDAASTFNVNQTTTGQTLTLPSPTSATAGRIVFVANVGTADFAMHGVTITNSKAQSYIWNGSDWVGTNIDGSGNGVTSVGTLDGTTKSANGGVVSANQLFFQTADATYPGLVSTGSQTFAGAKTFNGQIVAGAGIDLGTQTLQGTTAIINFTNFDVDASGNGDFAGTLAAGTADAFQVSSAGAVTAVGVNSGTGLIQGTGGLTVTGATSINTTGTANTSIGNTTGSVTLTGSGIAFNSSLLTRTAAGTTTFNLGDAADTTLAITNIFAGNANLTVEGSGTFGTGLTVTSGTLAVNGDSITADGATLTINAAGAIDLQDNVTADSLTLDTGSLTMSGVATDITTGTNEDLTVVADGTGVINLNDTVRIGALGATDTDAVVCRNAAGQLAACNSTFATTTDLAAAFIQGGNDFGANAVLGTNGAGQTLAFETEGTTKLILGTTGNLAFQQASTISTTSGALTLQPATTIELVANTNVTGNLDVSGGIALGSGGAINTGPSLGSSATYDNVLALQQTFTDLTTTDVVGGITNYVILDPSVNATSIVMGNHTQVEVAPGNANGIGTIYGSMNQIDIQGDGTTNSAISVYGNITHQGGGNLGTAVGAQIVIQSTGSGSISDAFGVWVGSHSGTITEAVGILVDEQSSGSVSNANLALGSKPGSGDYSLYSSSTKDSYFAGRLGIGDTSPAATLTVGNGDLFQVDGANGNITTAGTLAVNGDSITADGATLTINAAGAIDLQDNVTADSLTLDTGSLTMSGVATDITTGTNEDLTVVADGTGVINLNDTVRIGALGATDTDAVICRNAAGQLAACNSTFLTSANAFIQGGNSFGATAVLGTDDAFNLELQTAGVTRLTVDQSGNATLTGNLTVSGTGTSSFAGALTVDGNTTLGNANTDTLTITGTAVALPNSLNFDSDTLYIDGANNRVGIGTSTTTQNTVGSALTIIPQGGDAINGITIKAPNSTWGDAQAYGHGQVFEYLNHTCNGGISPDDCVLFRIDNTGGIGTASGIHVATGLRQDAGYSATQAVWVNPSIDIIGLILTGVSGGTADALRVQDGASEVGKITHSGLLQMANGGISAPTYSFRSDTDTGLYTSVANRLDFTTGGINSASLTAGALQLQNVNTDATIKTGLLAVGHYTNAQAAFSPLYAASTSTLNNVAIGGGNASYNAATNLFFYTAANNTTTTGSIRMRVDAGGNVGVGTSGAPGSLLSVGGTTGNFLLDGSGNVTSIGSYTFSGVATDITTGTNQDLTLVANGTGVISLNDTVDVANGLNVGTADAFQVAADGGVLAATAKTSGTGYSFDATDVAVNGMLIDVQSSSSSQFAFQVTSGNGSVNGISVRADGSVGIGTTGPQARLHIQGTADDEVLIVQGHSTQNANILEIKNSGGTVLAAVTGGGILKVGTTSAPTLGTAKLLVTEAEVTTRLRIGDATNGVSFNDEVSGQFRLRGTARNTKIISMIPEYVGAVLTGDGTNNTGTMTSDFCSGTSRRNINPSLCAATEENNYYSWTSQATNDYDIYIRYQLPSDFDGFASDTTIQMFGWRTTSTEEVELALFNAAGNQCGSGTDGTSIATTNNTWTQVSLAGVTGDAHCTDSDMQAGDTIMFRVRMTVGTNNNFARAGAITFSYLSKF